MSVLDRKLYRDIAHARGMLAATAGIIVVGISCFVMFATLYINLELSRATYYAQCRMADFSVELKKLPLSELSRLDAVAGISEFQPRIAFEVTVDLAGVERPLAGRVISLPDRPAPIINNIVLRQGGYFTDERRNEVIVNDSFARKRNVKPGQTIHVLLNNRRQELLVVGTAMSSEFVYLLSGGSIIPDPENYGVFYLKRSFAEEVFDFDGACNQIVGLVTPAYRDRSNQVLDELENRLEPFGVAHTTPLARQQSHWFLTNEIRQLRITVLVLPAIFLSVAALVLNVLMMRIAEQQRTVVGTLKATGYSNGALFLHFVKFGICVGLVGGVLGAAFGYWLASYMTGLYVQFFEFPRLINLPYPSVLVAGVAISVTFAVLGALRGVRTVMKLSPAEAMRPRPPRRGGSVLLERWRGLWTRLDFRWHMVVRGLFRSRMRTISGVAAAAVGASLILLTLATRDSMLELITFQFDKLLLSDYDVTFKNTRDARALDEAQGLPGIDAAEPLFGVGCTFRHGHHTHQGAITGISSTARLTIPRTATGDPVPIPEVGLLLTRKLAEVLHVRPGETVTAVPLSGRRDPLEMPVAAVIDSYLGMTAYAEFGYLNHLVGEDASLSGVQLLGQTGEAETAALYRALKQLPGVEAISANRESKALLKTVLLDKMFTSLFMIIAFSGLIFFGSVLNASMVSLAERRQEIATLRVLGYSPREVGGIFLRESLCLNLLGTMLGVPLGLWLSYFFCTLYNTELYRIPFVAKPASCAITVVLGLAFTLLAHLPVQRSIDRMDWLEALNVKE